MESVLYCGEQPQKLQSEKRVYLFIFHFDLFACANGHKGSLFSKCFLFLWSRKANFTTDSRDGDASHVGHGKCLI